jgi:hypothetical protein
VSNLLTAIAAMKPESYRINGGEWRLRPSPPPDAARLSLASLAQQAAYRASALETLSKSKDAPRFAFRGLCWT